MINKLEDFFITILRAANVLVFVFALIGALIYIKGQPAGVAFLVLAGTMISASIWCGVIALFMRMSDRLESQTQSLEKVAKNLTSINDIARRVTTKRPEQPQRQQ